MPVQPSAGAIIPVAQTQTLVPAPLAHSTPWPVVVDAYLAAAVDSPHTRRAYRRHLHTAFGWLGVETVAELNGAQLAAYRAELTGSRLAPASISQALTALRSFLSWAGSMGAHHLSPDAIKVALKTPKSYVARPYQVLADAEIADVLQMATTPRDKALLAVMLGAGLRAAEVVGLDVADVHDSQSGVVLHVRQGKGRKDRLVPIQPDVAKLVRGYLAATGRHLRSPGPLFRAHDRGAARRDRARLATRAVGYLVARACAAAGVEAKTISPHSLRHTFALRALRQGGNVVAVSKLLGHSSVQTTQRYVDHLALDELRAVVPLLPQVPAGSGAQDND
jgi:site-specific recombinase XerD